jgi:hypothetical protein
LRPSDPLDAGLAQQLLVGFAPKPTVGSDDVWSARDGPRMAHQRRRQQAAILWGSHVDLVMCDHPILGLGEQRLIAKLRLRAQLPTPNV